MVSCLGGSRSFQTRNALCSGTALHSGSPPWGAQHGILTNAHVHPPGVMGTRGEPWLLLSPPGSRLAPPSREHGGSAWVSSPGKDVKAPGCLCSIGGGSTVVGGLVSMRERRRRVLIYTDAPVCMHQPRELTTRCLGSDVTVQYVCGGWRFGGHGQLIRYMPDPHTNHTFILQSQCPRSHDGVPTPSML